MRLPAKVMFLAAAALAVLALAACGTRAANETEASASTTEPVELRVSAATSLRKVLEEVGPRFEDEQGVRLVFNFGSSGQLQKQIEAGAPADVFLSASPTQVDALVAGGYINAEKPVTFAGNDLVVFVRKGDSIGIAGPDDLAKADRLVTGDPDAAPHGAKSKEWLEARGIWSQLQSKFVFAQNSAQTLDYVARGEVDAGIGFESETVGRSDVEIAYRVPAGEIEPIRYVAAPLQDAEQPQLAAALIEFLLAEESQAALVDAGFNGVPAQ